MEAVQVIVHPLVILNVVDHAQRQPGHKRVLGCLLGERTGKRIEVTTSFAVPFEDPSLDENIWYMDSDYLMDMYKMIQRVTVNESIVGFYSSSIDILPTDMHIYERFEDFTELPILLTCDLRKECHELPTKAFILVPEITAKPGGKTRKFDQVSTILDTFDAEHTAIRRLMKDVNDPLVSTIEHQVKAKAEALYSFEEALQNMIQYLEDVITGVLPPNQTIIDRIQTHVSLIPQLSTKSIESEFSSKTNDIYLSLYVNSIVKSVLSIHELLLNVKRFTLDKKVEAETATAEKSGVKAPSKAQSPSDEPAKSP